jgi:hypothetical protein
MPAAPIIIVAASYAGVATTIGTAIVGGTVFASAATAIGTGVIAGALTGVQGGSSNDILKSAVLAGVGSYIGGKIASEVTSSVAANTGASLIDLEPALRGLSGEGITAGGAAAITAGNVAGQAVNAAITGKPIGEGALLGLATSIPTALTASQDFQSLNKVAQNVIASSLQASALGSDVGTAAITSLVISSDIVAKAIKQIPNGEEFIKQNPIFAKYIVDSVSSALVAKLAGADVNESVIASLARTTGDVLAREFQNAQNSNAITETKQKNDEATNLQEQVITKNNELNQLLATNKNDVDLFNNYLNTYSKEKSEFDNLNRRFNNLSKISADPAWQDYFNELAKEERLTKDQYIVKETNSLQNQIASKSNNLNNTIENLNEQFKKLEDINFFNIYERLVKEIKSIDYQYTKRVNDINVLANNLASTSAGLFNDFSTELETTLAPLTAFQDETVPDQDILAEIQPVAPPDELLAGGDTSQLPVEDQELLNQIQDVAQRPDITGQEGSTQLAGPQAPSFIDLIDRQNEQLSGGPQFSTETDGGVTINTYRQPVVGTLPDGRQYTYNIVIDVDTGERFYEYSTEIPSGQELVADTSVLTASRNKPDFQTMYAEPGAGGGGSDIAADIESIISGEGLVPEDVTEVVTDTTLPSQVQLPVVVTPTVAGGVTGGETIAQIPTGEVTDQEIKDVIDQQTPTVIGGKGEAPITPTLPGGAGETTVVNGEAPTTVTKGEAPTTVDTIINGDVAETGQASVPGGEISDEEIINIIVGEGNVPPSGELPATSVVGGEEAPTTVVSGEDTTPGGLPDETITDEAGADSVVGGGDQVVEIAPTVPGGEQIAPTIPGGGEIAPTIPGGGEIAPTIPGGEGEISDEDLINIIIGEGTPPTAGGGGEDIVVGGGEIPTVPGGEQVLPTVPGGDVTDILQPTLPGGAGEGDTVINGGGEADIVLGGSGEGEATLPGGEGEDSIGGGLGDGEITDQDIINIITGGDTGVGGGGEDTTPAGGGEDKVAPTIPGGDDEAILDLIRDLEQEEGMEEIPLEPETPVEEVTPPTTGTRPVVTVVPRQRGFQRPGEAAPYRVTGQDESGILGRKQPLFGGDEDLQRAEWNRRSLRLKRLLGL